MNISLKVFIFFIAMSTKTVAKSQQLLCLSSEKVMYDWKVNGYVIFSTAAMYDTVLIDKFHIQIKAKETDLTQLRELSKWSDKSGITKIYEMIYNKSKIVTVRLIETSEGISKIIIMDSPNSDYGTAYKLSKLISPKK